MNASQLRYLEIVHLGLKHKFRIFFTFRRFAKCSKNVPIIILGALHIFFIRKVSEMLQNTIIDIGSIGVECMLWLPNELCNFGGKK
jgi:hypothetical protein